MEPSTTSKYNAKDLFTPLSMLGCWNKVGFQRFLESGVLHDIVEAVRQQKISIIKIMEHGMVLPPNTCGDVSSDQALKFLLALQKVDIESFCVAFRAWSATAGWWEEKGEVYWTVREQWRIEMGLDPINLVFEKNGKRLFLRPGGKDFCFSGSKMENLPPKGFRFALLGELEEFGAKGEVSPIVFHDQEGRLSILLDDGVAYNYERRSVYLPQGRLYVALMKC